MGIGGLSFWGLLYLHRSESRWWSPLPKGGDFVRGYDSPRLVGAASHLLSGGIPNYNIYIYICLCLHWYIYIYWNFLSPGDRFCNMCWWLRWPKSCKLVHDFTAVTGSLRCTNMYISECWFHFLHIHHVHPFKNRPGQDVFCFNIPFWSAFLSDGFFHHVLERLSHQRFLSLLWDPGRWWNPGSEKWGHLGVEPKLRVGPQNGWWK